MYVGGGLRVCGQMHASSNGPEILRFLALLSFLLFGLQFVLYTQPDLFEWRC